MQTDQHNRRKEDQVVATPRTDPNLYAMILENIDRAVIAFDQAGQITLFNPAAEAFTGRSSRQVLGTHFRELFQGQKTLLYLAKVALEDGRSITDDEGLQLLRANAESLPVSAYSSPIFTSHGQQDGAVMIIRDLSRIKELEGTLRRADRLSLLGTLAAGLAHEIKNPLGGIKGAAQLLSRELGEDSDLDEYTQVTIREVERIDTIINELMDLGSPHPPVIGDVNLSKILGDIVLLQKEATRSKSISFLLQLDPSIPPIQGDDNLLTRLFLNLIKNACESIDRDGEVTIETRISPSYHLTSPGHKSSPMVDIKVQDTGCGIATVELDRIFTPYFTTKPKGSGLGLAISQKIVEDHNGFFKIESLPEMGTTVTISLPLRR